MGNLWRCHRRLCGGGLGGLGGRGGGPSFGGPARGPASLTLVFNMQRMLGFATRDASLGRRPGPARVTAPTSLSEHVGHTRLGHGPAGP